MARERKEEDCEEEEVEDLGEEEVEAGEVEVLEKAGRLVVPLPRLQRRLCYSCSKK